MTVGNDHLAGNSQTLFFAAGIDHEQHGLFGAIQNSQAGLSSTGGTLPYDPNSNDDDYPLPPAGGPTLGSDSGQPAPSPVLLSLGNSTFALAPTLSLSAAFVENQTGSSVLSFLSPTVPGAPQQSPNLGVAIGAIPMPGALSAFSSTSPMGLTSLDLPAARIGGRFELIDVHSYTPGALLLLDQYPSTDFSDPESRFHLMSAHVSPTQPAVISPAEPGGTLLLEGILGDFETEWGERRSLTSSRPGIPQPEAILSDSLELQRASFEEPPTTARTDNAPDAPFHTSVIRSFFVAVATYFPWSSYGAGKGWGRNRLSLRSRDNDKSSAGKA